MCIYIKSEPGLYTVVPNRELLDGLKELLCFSFPGLKSLIPHKPGYYTDELDLQQKLIALINKAEEK